MIKISHLLQDHEYKEAMPLPLKELSLSITSAERESPANQLLKDRTLKNKKSKN